MVIRIYEHEIAFVIALLYRRCPSNPQRKKQRLYALLLVNREDMGFHKQIKSERKRFLSVTKWGSKRLFIFSVTIDGHGHS